MVTPFFDTSIKYESTSVNAKKQWVYYYSNNITRTSKKKKKSNRTDGIYYMIQQVLIIVPPIIGRFVFPTWLSSPGRSYDFRSVYCPYFNQVKSVTQKKQTVVGLFLFLHLYFVLEYIQVYVQKAKKKIVTFFGFANLIIVARSSVGLFSIL